MKSKKIIAGLLALTFVFGGVVLPSGVVSNSLVASASSFRTGDSFYIDDIQYTIIGDGIVELHAYNPFEKTNGNFNVSSQVSASTSTGDVEEFTVKRIGEGAFKQCELEYITIPDTVTEICNAAFSNSYNLKSVLLPNELKSIGYQTFLNCKGLKSITLPDSVSNIGETAFAQCSSLSDLKLSDSLKNISQNAFTDCESLKSITIPDGVINIAQSAFHNCNKLEEIVIPESVTYIGNGAFTKCSSLETVVLPNNISIGDYVFDRCTNLKNINIPTGISSLPSSTFFGCSSLTDITIPDNIKEIKENAFYECKNLTNVTIPDGVTNIGDRTFWNCTALKNIQIPASVTYIGKDVFSYYDSNDNKVKPLDNVTIYCYADTFAEKYAKENGLKYQLIKPKLTYPTNIKFEYNQIYHQGRLTWDKVENAKEYGIAIYQAGKWRIQKQGITTTSYTTPRNLTPGKSYKVMIAAKVDGEWDTANAIKHAVTISIPNDTDSDGDGIEDFYENEENVSSYTIAPINDSWIDDSESISGKNPTIPLIDILGMNIIRSTTPVSPEDNNGPRKNELIAIRKRKSGSTDAQFSITPSRNSDFAFKITGTTETKPEGEYTTEDFNSTVKIFYKKGVFKKEEKQVKPVDYRLSDPVYYGDGTEIYTTIEYVFALEEGTEYTIYVNNPTNDHKGEYEIHISEDNWVYAPDGAYTEVCFETEEYDKISSHQIYIPSDIIDNLYWETNKWHIVKDEYSEDDYTFKNRCNDAAGSTVFKGDHYIELENYNELVSEIGSKATVGGVVTATFTNGKFIGINLFGKYVETIGAGSTVGGVLVTLVGGYCLLLQSKATADLEEFRTNLQDSLYNGRANLIYNSTYHTTQGFDEIIQTNYQWWSAWNDKHYINKYTERFFGCDKIFDDKTYRCRQNIHTELKYYGYMQDDPENHFWDLYATQS